MSLNYILVSRLTILLLLVLAIYLTPSVASGQRRGTYTPGINATNSGTQPDPGLTYSNIFELYSFDKLKGPDGENIPVNGDLSVFVDHNVFIWVSKKKMLGGASFMLLADLPVANNSLTSANFGTLGGGGGLADTFYQPVALGWKKERADFQVGYSFTAPTGRFNAGASDNVGTGYWTNGPTAGETFYLTKNKATAISAYQYYEFHGNQETTDIHPGQNFNLDYSLTQVVPLKKDMSRLLQLGFVGYGQWQTTDRSGPGLNPVIEANTHYRVNAMGAAANIILPARKASLGFKYFKEFSNKSTVEGYSIQISGAITF
jgi:hypothetical protein